MSDNPVFSEYISRAEAWLPSVIARDPSVTSADKAYQWFREHEMYVPRRWVREAWADTIRGKSYTDYMSALDRNDVIPTSWMSPTTFQYGAKYNYIIKGQGGDPSNPDAGDWVTITSDVLLTQGEVIDAAVNLYHEYGLETDLPEFDVSFELVKYRS